MGLGHHGRNDQAPRRQGTVHQIIAGSLSLVLLALLTACGASTSGSAQSFPTATNIPTTPGTATLNGCPEQQQPITATIPEVVVHSTTVQGLTQTVAAKVGQTIEIELPATFRWALISQDAESILTAPATNGWFEATQGDCIWQFTATKAGSATLKFAGGQVCSSASKCSDIATEKAFTVAVK